MKLLLIAIFTFIVLSCDEENVQIVNFRVNHFQQTATGVSQTLVLLIQTAEDIGKEDWSLFYSTIDGFDYEAGYVYDLMVELRKVKNAPIDAPSVHYVLNKVISKEKVADDIEFEINLKSVTRSSPPSFVTGDVTSGFKILDQVEIDCNSLCNELNQMLEEEDELSGIFLHAETESIKLIELKKE